VNLVVVGDSLLDIDVHGCITGLCPDTPAPVLDQSARRVRAGGAGLAAWLAAGGGDDVTLVTALGEDGEAELLRAQLSAVHTLFGPAGGSTPVKTRLRADGRTLARIDRCPPSRPFVTDEMLDAVSAADAVLVSDYGRGIARDWRLRRVLAGLVDRVPVVWDPHPRGAVPICGVALATPNLAEARKLSGGPAGESGEELPRAEAAAASAAAATAAAATAKAAASVDAVRASAAAEAASAEAAATALRSLWQAAAVAVTLGSRGALLDDGESRHLAPAPAVTVTDPCGAGDHFAGTVAARLMHGDGLADAVEYAVDAASRFLADGGVSTIGRLDVGAVDSGLTGSLASGSTGSPASVLTGPPASVLAGPRGEGLTGQRAASIPRPRPRNPLAAAKALAAAVRAAGGLVVATGGCFDLLHAGHTRTLNTARGLGDCLIVCMNSDASVARLKGTGRPINGQSDRAELLRSLASVDEVVIFDEDGPERLLEQLHPDVWVKGGDYAADALPEADLVRAWGGAIVVLPYHEGRSSTRLARELSVACS
jgi:D-beta-D-heptose 7-phosphate kinase / D-beta-D-heptose 1-phosphate adenosyltransferase